MQRIFAAVKINPDPGLMQLLKHLQSALAKDKIKWVDPCNLHLTLKFFGETHEEKVLQIADILKTIQLPTAFQLKCRQLGIFGSSYKPRVIWLGVDNSLGLMQMESEISKVIQSIGYLPDRQNYIPHLTLGRINFLNDKNYFQQIIVAGNSFSIESQSILAFHLYESKLYPSGPEYRIIKSYNLNQ